MQLLNVSQGGKLFLHIPEDLPKALPHNDPLDPAHRHALEVVPGTLMERVYGDGEIRVNSMHHMAIDEVAPGFRVTARCPDGVVEAIESTRTIGSPSARSSIPRASRPRRWTCGSSRNSCSASPARSAGPHGGVTHQRKAGDTIAGFTLRTHPRACPGLVKTRRIHAAWAGQAAAVTRLPSVWALSKPALWLGPTAADRFDLRLDRGIGHATAPRRASAATNTWGP